MNEALPAAASTSGRFFLATLAYMPHWPRTPDYQTSDRSAILTVRALGQAQSFHPTARPAADRACRRNGALRRRRL